MLINVSVSICSVLKLTQIVLCFTSSSVKFTIRLNGATDTQLPLKMASLRTTWMTSSRMTSQAHFASKATSWPKMSNCLKLNQETFLSSMTPELTPSVSTQGLSSRACYIMRQLSALWSLLIDLIVNDNNNAYPAAFKIAKR